MKKLLAFAFIFTACTSNTDKNEPAFTKTIEAAEPKKETPSYYQYEPVISELSGTITTEDFWGPPGYGEDTTTDLKERCDILTLEKAIDVNEDTTNEFNTEQKNIDLIQLASDINTKDFIGKKVIIKGQLFGAHTRHHRTPVLLFVKEITESK